MYCTYELGFLGVLLLLMSGYKYADGQECPRSDSAPNKEASLMEELLCNYDVNDKPVKNDSQTVNVIMDLLPIHLRVEQNEAGNFVTVSSWILLTWIDEYLNWENKTEYANIKELHISSDRIWMPQVILFNSGVKHPSTMHTFVTECEVSRAGGVACAAHAMNKAVCEMDLTTWPYDAQACSLVFRIWLHYDTSVNLTVFNEDAGKGHELNVKINRQFYEKNVYWRLDKLTVSSDKEDYFSNRGIEFTFYIRRQSTMLSAFIVGPAIAMILMTLTSIALKCDSADRINLLGVSLLGHVIYLQQLSWIVPASGDKCALVVLFFRDSTLVTVMVLLATSALRHDHMWSARCLNSMSKVIYTVPGKVIMYPGLAQDDSKTIVSEEADGTDNPTTKIDTETTQKKTQLMRVFANRILFLVAAITYFGLCVGLLVGIKK